MATLHVGYMLWFVSHRIHSWIRVSRFTYIFQTNLAVSLSHTHAVADTNNSAVCRASAAVAVAAVIVRAAFLNQSTLRRCNDRLCVSVRPATQKLPVLSHKLAFHRHSTGCLYTVNYWARNKIAGAVCANIKLIKVSGNASRFEESAYISVWLIRVWNNGHPLRVCVCGSTLCLFGGILSHLSTSNVSR